VSGQGVHSVGDRHPVSPDAHTPVRADGCDPPPAPITSRSTWGSRLRLERHRGRGSTSGTGRTRTGSPGSSRRGDARRRPHAAGRRRRSQLERLILEPTRRPHVRHLACTWTPFRTPTFRVQAEARGFELVGVPPLEPRRVGLDVPGPRSWTQVRPLGRAARARRITLRERCTDPDVLECSTRRNTRPWRSRRRPLHVQILDDVQRRFRRPRAHRST
jgi:hypothetical protein